jgi:GTP-binding protein EngB required for normal cell division
MKKSITVGIIGIPNVGKSSLINSLKRAKAVGVGATPGFTKAAQVLIVIIFSIPSYFWQFFRLFERRSDPLF